MRRIYICRDNVTGIFSAVYDAWKECRHTGDAGIALRGNMDTQFFCDYVETEQSEEKALAVEKLIVNHLGTEAYRGIYYAALADDPLKGDAILGTMLAARKIADSRKIMEYLTNPSVEKLFELRRRVGNESHFFKEILRFRELENGILYARMDPKNQVLTCIAPHFADRLPQENWLIYDGTHRVFAVHQVGKSWVLLSGEEADISRIERFSEEESEIQKLWKGFFKSISVQERESYTRQRQHLPLWYRKNMVEFEQN